jgi:hypothetical protein
MCAYKPSFTYTNPLYEPAMRVISSITNAYYPTVTTTVAHNYQPGITARFDIPLGFGMQQLNQQVGTILSVPTSTTFTISVDTRKYDPFVLPSGFPPPYQDAQIVPVGDSGDYNLALQNVYPLNSDPYL